MKCNENECTPQGTRIYSGEVTSPHKKYCPAILVGLQGIGDGLVRRNFNCQGSGPKKTVFNIPFFKNCAYVRQLGAVKSIIH